MPDCLAERVGLIRSLRSLTPAGRTACVQNRCAILSNRVLIPDPLGKIAKGPGRALS